MGRGAGAGRPRGGIGLGIGKWGTLVRWDTVDQLEVQLHQGDYYIFWSGHYILFCNQEVNMHSDMALNFRTFSFFHNNSITLI